MYKAIVNKVTNRVYWMGDGIHWVPLVPSNMIPDFEIVDCQGDMPSIGEGEQARYDSTGPSIVTESAPSIVYEGETIYDRQKISELADKKIFKEIEDNPVRSFVRLLKLWRASHILNNQADFTAPQIAQATNMVDNGLATFSRIQTLLQSQAQAETDFDAL